MPTLLRPLLLVCAASAVACSSNASALRPGAAAAKIAPAPPPKDDGKPAKGGDGGAKHAAALEELKVAPLGVRIDKQSSIRVPLPDPQHWMRVKFWGIPSLVGFRYGKDHHAVVGAVVTHPEDGDLSPAGCMRSFEDWAQPLVRMFDVDLDQQPVTAFDWAGKQAGMEIVDARTATLAMSDDYFVAYATYPAWKGACLVVGMAVPARDEPQRARDVRDRFVREVLPKIEVTRDEEPKDRY